MLQISRNHQPFHPPLRPQVVAELLETADRQVPWWIKCGGYPKKWYSDKWLLKWYPIQQPFGVYQSIFYFKCSLGYGWVLIPEAKEAKQQYTTSAVCAHLCGKFFRWDFSPGRRLRPGDSHLAPRFSRCREELHRGRCGRHFPGWQSCQLRIPDARSAKYTGVYCLAIALINESGEHDSDSWLISECISSICWVNTSMLFPDSDLIPLGTPQKPSCSKKNEVNSMTTSKIIIKIINGCYKPCPLVGLWHWLSHIGFVHHWDMSHRTLLGMGGMGCRCLEMLRSTDSMAMAEQTARVYQRMRVNHLPTWPFSSIFPCDDQSWGKSIVVRRFSWWTIDLPTLTCTVSVSTTLNGSSFRKPPCSMIFA